jgi:hypothetical protein
MLQAERSWVGYHMRSLSFVFNIPNPARRTMALEFIQHLKEMDTGNCSGG